MTAADRAVDAEQLITIGELSRRTGLAISALRYYEEVGLLEPQARVSGQRRYAADAVDAVGLIRVLRDVHFTLGEIEQMARDGWRALARRKMTELDDLIASATAARAALDHALECPHSEPAECPTARRIVKRHQAGEPLAQAHRHSHPEPDAQADS